ncbi:MAG: hypothetical protein A3D92_21590, partial [Bacteroidetes bacterium RIFCSPHIGHO2_02_FULL_44_7]
MYIYALLNSNSMDIFWLILGLAVLVFGGEFLVKGAVGFSKTMKISPLVVGMTIVAFGTSAPELIVSLTSALNGNSGIAVGNVVGSNIANITIVLGLTVLIFPIIADRQTKRLDLPMMLLSTLLLYFFVMDGLVERYEGIIMATILIGFTIYLINYARKKSIAEGNLDWEDERKTPSYWRAMFFMLVGFVGLYFGADWFVKGAVGIADLLLHDNPEKDTIIGVTVVAFGTSAPELVASTVAAYRKQTDISVGNLIGSNIFNILIVLGLTAVVTPTPVTPEVLGFDIWWVIGTALLLAAAILIGHRIGRLKG